MLSSVEVSTDTASDDATDESAASNEVAQPAVEHVYKPKPPLWRPARQKTSLLEIVVGAVTLTTVVALGILFLEDDFLTGSATAMLVKIASVERVSHHEESVGSITYRVTLPDGSDARLTSAGHHRPGTRLMAMVSRGLITGRTFVSSPYTVFPDE